MMALSNDADPDSALMQRVARRFIFVSTFLWTKPQEESPTSASGSSSLPLIRENKHCHEDENLHDDGNDSSYRLSNNFDQSRNSVNSRASFVSQFMEAMPSQKEESSENFKEMFLAGTVIHIVPEKKNVDIPLYKRWATPDAQCGYEAYVANREVFKDMIVSPSMFIDHLPWRNGWLMMFACAEENTGKEKTSTRVGWCELETMMNYDLPFQSNGPTNSTDHQHIRIFFSSEILDANTEQDINLQNKISNYEHHLATLGNIGCSQHYRRSTRKQSSYPWVFSRIEILKHLDARALGSAGCVNTNGTVRPKSRLMELEFALKNNWANNTQLRSVVLALAEFQQVGLLTSLLGAGCECEGYDLRVVGHSLGGAIAAMLGLKKVARRFLSVSTFLWTKRQEESPTSASGSDKGNPVTSTLKIIAVRIQEPCEDFNLWHDMHMYDSSDDGNDSSYRLSNNFDQSRNSVNSRASFVSQFMEAMPSQKDDSSENFKEMLLAGTVIHIVPEKKNVDIPLYKRWATPDAQCGYEAYVANQEAFKDMIVSPSMFIDHLLPWRCSHALKRILEKRKFQHELDGVSLRP
ncbi:Sn1-specific diacylglycerol lipase beta [Tanacetum coccineum]|uniref:Sn1-specific diacylglycerol lipase beta n=1 Tax=Tanacetum coccineum TaxID=301880 RepID=A0ABQ5HRU5_9ASTR